MKALVVAAFALVMATGAFAQAADDIPISRAAVPPKIDGVLDDEAWKVTPLPMTFDQWKSYNPVRGDTMPEIFRTEVRITYDDRNIYFAFHCFDNEPDKIRTNVSRRDSAFSDDWIAVSLDSAGTGQTAFHLFSNPSGSQMDAINTSSSGEQFDADIVWYSVANTTSDGYVVEVQVPLQTLRFKGGDKVRMGLVFFRKVSRTGVSYAWPEMLPGQWVFDRPSHIVFDGLKPRRLVELLPSVTYGVNQAREESSSAWAEADNDAHVGASGKFGITSAVTLDGTINPDFSQVESDAFQIEVNQRFPVFFSEKRPFFMEGMGLFNIARGDNMRTAVHTRRIVDPVFGAKLTGTLGKTTFGVLNSLDDHPGDVGDRGDEFADRNKLFTIGRATYALRRSDYVGAILTQTQHAGRSNFATGADFSIRPSSSQSLSGMFLTTATSERDRHERQCRASWRTNSRRAAIQSRWQAEHYDRDFQMDTAFYNRTGFTSGLTYNEVNFYPRGGQNFWLQRIHPFVFAKYGHDASRTATKYFVNTGLQLQFHPAGQLRTSRSRAARRRGRASSSTPATTSSCSAGMQVVRWFSVFGGGGSGPAIYYDEVDPFQGRSLFSFFGFTFQPNQHLTQEHRRQHEPLRSRIDRRADLRRHRAQLEDDLSVRQPLPVRLLLQYDSSEHRVLTDLLASYELVPGTVFHAGYGSLYERGQSDASSERRQQPGAPRGKVSGDESRVVLQGVYLKVLNGRLTRMLFMALTATIYNFDIDLSDSDRGVYETVALRVAQHPSESDEYLIARVLAYLLEHAEGIVFSRGVSEPEEPMISVRDLTGKIRSWIEIGTPDSARLHKASKAADRVAVYCHKEHAQWLKGLGAAGIHRADALELYAIDRA